MVKSNEALYQERLKRLQDAMDLKIPDRVPVAFVIDTWAASYAGITIQDMAFDYDKLIMANEKTFAFNCDGAFPPVATRPGPVFEALECQGFVFSGGDTAAGSTLQHIEKYEIMSPEEYPELIADPYRFMIEKVLPRRFSALKKPYPRNALSLTKGAMLLMQYLNIIGTLPDKWREKYGMPTLTWGAVTVPFDVIEDFLRTFKGIFIDIKRRPEEVKAACNALLPLMIKQAKVCYGGPPEGFSPIFIPLHVGSFMRPKDFEEFYWPTFKGLIESLAAEGYTFFILFEGNWDYLLDYLAELPKKKIIGFFENSDMKKVKEKLGKTMCIGGNFPTTLLNYGTKKEVIDQARKILDDLAPGGGYIFSSDKELISANDANPENLKAVIDFVQEYGVY